ncbi:hypothetical protein PSTG_16607 [Puccinia striiformis f. sp. tritici PST-78]|uniref:No apical meristem-associated C-terminal domain-containing protein n=1 Tax=Puccinia striiformis f. sp. tritici PST-78 TaxID=1165861 RepID=A0A0L0USN6_9BASI|nr:hypothetical protein PSTG_16607 [Puccinia striiformis f. sp. tritici PST-78]
MPPKKTVQSTPSRTPIGTKKAVQKNGRTVDVGINSSTSELINPPAKKARKEPAQDTGQDKDEQYGDFEGSDNSADEIIDASDNGDDEDAEDDDTFWSRVAEHYRAEVPEPYQTFNSIKSHWGAVHRRVNKFNGYLKEIKLANKSGVNEIDKFKRARKLYEQCEKGKPFKHMQCFDILEPVPKWNIYCQELARIEASKSSTQNSVQRSTKSGETSDFGSKTAIMENTNELERAVGNKRAKEARLQDIKDNKWKDELVKVHRDLAGETQIQNKLLAKQKEVLVMIAQDAIMYTEITPDMSARRREFLEYGQQKIIDQITEEKEVKIKAEENRKREEEEKKKKGEEEKKKKEEDEKRKKEEDDKKKKEEEEKKMKEAEQKKKKAAATRLNARKHKAQEQDADLDE